jgi:hypothetical protein
LAVRKKYEKAGLPRVLERHCLGGSTQSQMLRVRHTFSCKRLTPPQASQDVVPTWTIERRACGTPSMGVAGRFGPPETRRSRQAETGQLLTVAMGRCLALCLIDSIGVSSIIARLGPRRAEVQYAKCGFLTGVAVESAALRPFTDRSLGLHLRVDPETSHVLPTRRAMPALLPGGVQPVATCSCGECGSGC